MLTRDFRRHDRPCWKGCGESFAISDFWGLNNRSRGKYVRRSTSPPAIKESPSWF
jgi:hypothetical protein